MKNIVVAVISMMVVLFVGVIVVTNLINSVTPDSTWSQSANDTWAALQSNVWIAFTLLVIAPIILGAVAILSYLGWGKGGGG